MHAAGIHHAGALHPNFIQPLVSGLSPTADEITWANKVVETFDKLTVEGEAVTQFEGKVIDKYENNLAKRTLDWTKACAEKDAYKTQTLARTLAAEKSPS
jgi:citrate lyase beta subunit